ncbi:MAG: transcriptional regulator [Rubrivivax sp.]|jgi:nitrogen regulatory protein P-II 2|nr:transcriptional regulator [Rubrivivax sp.]
MTTTRHPKTLLVIITEAVLEKNLVRDVRDLGAQGWTAVDVRGGGHSGVREGAWEADRTIELKVVCEAAVADAIAAHVLREYAPHFSVAMYFSDVAVLRPHRY